MRFPRPTPALVVAMLALLVALGGTAVATIKATGTATNIVDPTTATRIAKVDATGKLYVGDGLGAMTVDGTVFNRPAVPLTPFGFYQYVSNFFQGGGTVVLAGPTTATLAITRIAYTNGIANTDPWEVYLWQSSGSTASACLQFSDYEQLEHINVPARGTHESNYADAPIYLKPRTAGTPYCIVARGGPSHDTGSTTNTWPVTVSFNGYVGAGTFIPPTRTPDGPPAGLGF